MNHRLLTVIFCLLIQNVANTQKIVLDEIYSDWSSSTPYQDAGDVSSSQVDIREVRVANDDINLYLNIELSREINIQSNNGLGMYVDIDNNAATGLSINGMGADMIYKFGDREGLGYYNASQSIPIYHDEVGLMTSPTVTSKVFEVAIKRTSKVFNYNFKMGGTVKVLVYDIDTGDKAPNSNAISYTFDNTVLSNVKPFGMNKDNIDDVRFLSYNVLRDNLFEPSLDANYKRIFKAIRPDVIGFCEIYDNNATKVKTLIESYIPSTGTQKWYADEVSPDIRIVSRYPIVERLALDGNGVFVLDVNGKKWLYFVAHLPCCDNETTRQREVDKIMGFIRDVRYGIASINVPQNTPIVISGDMNLVGLREQQQTFITGNIINNTTYGPDFKPDWDNSDFEDAKPLTINQAATYTWYNSSGSYSAGRLDYFYYSGSVISLKNNYALMSSNLNAAQLTLTGLQANDVLLASDHLPLVADFSLDLTSNTADDVENIDVQWAMNGNDLQLYNVSNANVQVVDILGRNWPVNIVSTDDLTIIEMENLPRMQVYFIKVATTQGTKTIKLVR